MNSYQVCFYSQKNVISAYSEQAIYYDLKYPYSAILLPTVSIEMPRPSFSALLCGLYVNYM